jgi:hypothetical protein
VLAERDITIEELLHAYRVAVVNSLRGWREAELAATPLLPQE